MNRPSGMTSTIVNFTYNCLKIGNGFSMHTTLVLRYTDNVHTAALLPVYYSGEPVCETPIHHSLTNTCAPTVKKWYMVRTICMLVEYWDS